MKSFALRAALAVFAVAGCARGVAAEEQLGEELVLGEGLRISLMQPGQTSEQLPNPAGHHRAQPIPLPPVDSTDSLLTLSEAESLAMSFHPAMREAGARVRAAQGNWLQVGLRPNPNLGYSGEEIGDQGTAGKQGGFISQEFVTAGKLGLNRAVAGREVAAAQQQVERTRLQVLTSVRIHYFELLAAQRAVALARQLGEIAQQSVHVSELRLKALDIPRVSLLQSQVERESTTLLEEQALQRHAAAWRRLATALGMHDAKQPELEDALMRPLPALDWETARTRMLTESPELSELHYLVERARWQLQRASAGRVPNLNLQTGVQHDNESGDEIANVQLSMPLPIFNRNQGAIAEAGGELAAAQAALEKKELELEQRLAKAMRDYETSRERATRYAERILPVARETLNLTAAGYREGELDFLEVLSIQRTYAEKNVLYLQDLETAWKQWAEIDALLVGPLSEQEP